MSAAQKDSLFGKAPKTGAGSGKTSTTAGVSSTASSTATALKPISRTAGIATSPTTNYSATAAASAIPVALRTKKMAEGQGFLDRARAQLKTSIFQWSPDHLAAAPLLEMAADCYKTAGEYDTACDLFIQGSQSHEKYGSQSASGAALMKAAQVRKTQGKIRECVTLMAQAAECWGIGGDIIKYGETLAKAALESQAVDSKEASSLYFKAVDILMPNNDPKNTSPALVDILRNAVSFHVSNNMYKEAISMAQKMIIISNHYDTESTTCKYMVSITILQLALGDAVQAQQTYTQEHLSNSKYLRSKECELADMLVMAFNNLDLDTLDAALAFSQLNYLDKAIQKVAKSLSLVGANTPEMPATTTSSAGIKKSNITTSALAAPSESVAVGADDEDDDEGLSNALEGLDTGGDSAAPQVAYAAADVVDDNDNDNAVHAVEGGHVNKPPPVISNLEDDDEDELDLS